MKVAIVCFSLLVLLPSVTPECLEPWVGVPSLAETCVMFDNTPRSWMDARAICRENGGELLNSMIALLARNLPAIEKLYKGTRTKFWTGIYKPDGDATFRSVDGNPVNDDKFGVKSTSLKEDSVEKKAAGMCIFVSTDSKTPWSADACTAKLPFICEGAKAALKKEKHNCDKHDWWHFQKGYKFLTTPKDAMMTHPEAVLQCEGLGGQLLTIHDNHTQHYVEQMHVKLKDNGAFWIGLRREGSQQAWRWVDDVELTSGEYDNWLNPNFTTGDCGVLTWDHPAAWHGYACTKKCNYICEATKPCFSRPVFTVNGGKRLENAGVVLTEEQHILVTCSLRGYTKRVYGVRLECEGRQKQEKQEKEALLETGSRAAALVLKVDFKMHRKKCVCRSNLPGGNTDETKLIINYRGSPRLLIEFKDKPEVVHRKGDRITRLEVPIFSNPKPKRVNLTSEGGKKSQQNFSVNIETFGSRMSMLSSVVISMIGVLDKHAGEYTLVVDNGFQEKLYLAFELLVLDALKPTDSHVDGTGVLIVVLVTTLYLSLRLAMTLVFAKDLKNTHTDFIYLIDLLNQHPSWAIAEESQTKLVDFGTEWEDPWAIS